MNWELFKDYFDESWYNKIKPFIESTECDRIYEFLKNESKRGKKIAPLSSNVFRCFKETSLDNIKAVMMGVCPYHTFKDRKPVADGVLMSCTITGKLQPSLEQFYDGIIAYETAKTKQECCLLKDPDLSYLCRQGVLMFNASLTCELNKPGSHLSIWEPFTKYILNDVLGATEVPVIFLGKDAAKFGKYTFPFTRTFIVSHPASASYNNTVWNCEGVFDKVNWILRGNNNEEIKWFKTYRE